MIALRHLLPVCLIALAPPAFGQEASPPAEQSGAQILVLSQQLFRLGRAQKDALTVLSAARLAGSVALQEGTPLRNGPSPTAPLDASPLAQAEPSAMLALAEELAGEDEAMLMLIASARAESSSPSLATAIRRSATLAGMAEDQWQVPFYGLDYGELAVLGSGSSNLDITLTDDKGATLCRETGPSDVLLCGLLPDHNGFVTLHVKNLGSAPNTYAVITN
jgi:hypothetical protein